MASSEFTKESIIVGTNLIRDFLPKDLPIATPKTSKYVVITDTAVHRLHFGLLLEGLHAAVPVGEQTKSREQKASIEDWMLENECNRDTCIIALGGGVVGDLAGFVAATYLRGIPFIQVPTTLLAMVDSSIGGKTGINTSKAKNLIGAFYQPVRIYIDIAFLRTLPKRQIANGMAEVIKSFAIRNEEMFGVLEECYDKVFDPVANYDIMHEIIVECVKIKAKVVTEDETENGVRSLLNFGHTVGHAIESVCMDFMLHGECVAIGMVKEAEIARAMGHLAPSVVARLASCIRAYTLPLAIPEEGSHTATLMKKMALDKKNVGGKKKCVILTRIGACLNDVAQLVDDSLLLRSVSKPIVVVPPSAPIQGSIRVPGSKSISNRVLLLAAMGEGECRVGGLLHSDDTQVMMNALKQLGAAEFRYEKSGNVHDTEPILVVKGNGGRMTAPPGGKHIYLGNAGTATRFLATLCTLVGVYSSPNAAEKQKVVLTGDKRMCERPIKDLVVALKQHQDCVVGYLGTDGCPPLEIHGTGLRGGKIQLAADVSSQFVSSILLSAPYANTPVTLELDPHKEVVSQPYIDMTVSLMRDFGVDVQVSANKRTYIVPKRPYRNPPHCEVESDASSSTYPLVMAAITGGKVTALNVTSKSLQGDAQFCKVLEKMGCTVSQDEQKTIVEGPKNGGLRGVDYNMGDLTDAFMGVACLAAVAQGTTRITGIANQRVKECNRIQVMVEELSKLGVKCKELEDGVEIEGLELSKFKPGAINCYNDHRIAMSFACLGCKVPNITIKDKECVQKTYPEFWDDLANVFGAKLGVPPVEEPAKPATQQNGPPRRVIIIGMRGAGKTSQGRVAASALGYTFVDVDEAFEARVEPHNIKTFIETQGWDKFRDQELRILQDILSEHKGKEVMVSCGGGIVETESARKVLTALANSKDTSVIFFQRHIDDIVEFLLEKDKVRPAFSEHPSAVYARRYEHYRSCSTHEFFIRKGDLDWQAIEAEFIDFVSQVTGKSTQKFVQNSASNVEHDLGSFFISLTFPDYTMVPKKTIESLSAGVHGLELRADLIDPKEQKELHRELMGEQFAALRRSNTHHIPIIFTIRTKPQGGAFTDDEQALFSLLHQGIRFGAEYIDVESCWSKESLEKIASLKETSPSSFKIISSFHCYDPKIWESDDKILALFNKCYFSKLVDVVKVVLQATEAQTHGVRIHRLADQWRLSHPGVPTIVLCTGEKGRIARVMNRFFTPVTHPLLTTVAAPGQMSVKEIHLARSGLGFIPKKNFYLFGSPISQSRSPLIHNTGFKVLGLPHEYQLFETMNIEEISKKIREPTTFGASVTIPHKLDVIPLVDKLSDHAKQIGAVNTIYKVATPEGWEVWGDNTDFLGVKGLLSALLGKREPLHALVLGAGGTSRAVLYALNRMNAEGYKFTKHLYNRTVDKAQALAQEFDCHVITSLSQNGNFAPDVVISTLPPPAQAELFAGEDPAKFVWLFYKCRLAMDLVYRPRETPVLKMAKDKGVPHIVEGIEILLEQGYAQFCIWTGSRAAPTNEIREVVMASL